MALLTTERREPQGMLLTGATGFVGRELLARILDQTDSTVYTPVRASDDDAAEARVRDALASLGRSEPGFGERVVAFAADIERPRLGLDEERLDELAEEVDEVLHTAASVSFALSLDESRRINVDGTRHVLELAAHCRRHGGLHAFSYVSTAYVAGDHAGLFRECDLDVGQGFRNAYEQSKFEAEHLLREFACSERLPFRVFRPSIIVGDRESGRTTTFNVLYAPLKAFAKGGFYALPARHHSPVDVVPVDYVADAVLELSRRPADGGTYHLVAGRHASTVGRLMQIAAGYFGRPVPPTLPPGIYMRLVHPLLRRLTRGRKRRALERSEVYFPYFGMRVRYDDACTRRDLEPSGVAVTPIETYFERLVDFAVESDWGRRISNRAPSEPVAH